MELEKNLEINSLINLYGNLLTPKQQSIVKGYFFYDNSLSELATEFGITRQAVSDLINRVVKTLYKYEQKLNLLNKNTKLTATINNLLKTETNPQTKKLLIKLIHILEE